MAWQSRGLRGSSLEELINMTNEKYREHGLALIQKIPTPIKPIKLDKEKGHISLAYFEKSSTVDYIGVVQGIPVCFEAKETVKDYFPMQNIHPHQISFMQDFEKQGGIAFLIIDFTALNKTYFLPFKRVNEFFLKIQEGGRKRIPLSEFKDENIISSKAGYFLHYLENLKQFIVENNL